MTRGLRRMRRPLRKNNAQADSTHDAMFRSSLHVPLLLLSAMTLLTNPAKADSVILGGGCFWCMDAAYKLLPGVTHITCGYAGGTAQNPTYEQVCTEETGHAEVVKVDFDPSKVTLERVLDYFWESHDPTQVGGQGNDMGSQYRSIILYADPAQKLAAEKSEAQAQKLRRDPIVTEIVPLKKFWAAEDYHQDYFEKHPDQGYCSVVIRPKVQKLKELLESGK
jgi:peptide-methionine (S)-S-oxide reductase